VIRTAAIVAAAVAAVLLNITLLARASGGSDPVGHLRPRTHVPAAPGWTVRPAHGEVENEGADD
jgi:hypothetical protein